MSISGDIGTSKFGAVLLGASEFPGYPAERRLDNPSFARSAKAIRALLEQDHTFVLGKPSVLDLFDSDEGPTETVKHLREFLKAPGLTDVLLFYCGHGDFLFDQRYYLLLRSTEADDEPFTGLAWQSTMQALSAVLAMKRVFILLDCCFAGEAVKQFQTNAIGSVIERQTGRPGRGAALVAAAAKGQAALAPSGEPLTMFTTAFVDTVSKGIANGPAEISMHDVVDEMRKCMPARFGASAVLPEIHDPVQPDGDVSALPLFFNRGYVPPKHRQATRAQRESYDHAVNGLTQQLPGFRLAALDELAELLGSATSATFVAEIIERITKCAREDDSLKVRAKCDELLTDHAPSSLSLPASSKISSPDVAPPNHGAYSRTTASKYIGKYFMYRRTFDGKNNVVRSLCEMNWNNSIPCLTFYENQRRKKNENQQQDYSQRGEIFMPEDTGYLHLLTCGEGSVRVLTLSKLKFGQMRGAILTLRHQPLFYQPTVSPVLVEKISDSSDQDTLESRVGEVGRDELGFKHIEEKLRSIEHDLIFFAKTAQES